MNIREKLKNVSNRLGHLDGTPREKGLVSVCVPNFNKENYVDSALDSIRTQTYKKIELIVVDDCSTDNSVRVIEDYVSRHQKEFYSLVFLRSPRRLGNAWATNLAYYLSRGEFIAQMDSDDYSYPDRISYQVEYLQQNDYDLVGTNFCTSENKISNVVNEDGGYWLKFTDSDISESCKKGIHCVCFGTILFKHKVVDVLGGLTKNLVGTEDWDFIDRVFKEGFKIGNLRDVLYVYRFNPTQRSTLYHKLSK